MPRDTLRQTIIVVLVIACIIFLKGDVAGQALQSLRASTVQGIPSEDVVLVVSGRVASSTPIQLDLETIRSFPRTTIECDCPHLDTGHDHTGVLLLSMLEQLGLDQTAESVEVRAANRYSVRIRIEDLRRHRYLLAYQLDGTPNDEHDNLARIGPLSIAVDFAPEYGVDLGVYRYQCVWQVTEIVVL